ncbi:hypothetical protein ACFQ21_26570 [Ohtaekwangia kribbensis]|uniref:Uncharacterized protein n=1 Tax=Ohtaekwangia kribbensis TaxID=688913 RepID=A0ABW3KA78_9BACT
MNSKIIYVLVTFLACLISASVSTAQAVDVRKNTITGTASESIDLLIGKTYTKNVVFTTRGDQGIDIPNRMLSDIQVTKVEGIWNDFQLPGKLVYSVLMNGKEGIVTLEKNATDTSLIIDTTGSSPDGVKRKFIIDKVKVNN